METEIWKSVVGYEGLYEVSNLGQVKSYHWSRVKILKPVKSKRTGYYCITLVNKQGQKVKDIHRLMALAFLEKDPERLFINHKDGDKSNNQLSNFEWTNRIENASHAAKLGLYKSGEYHSNAKLNKSKVEEIKNLYCSGGHTHKSLGFIFNISPVSIGKAIRGITYRRK